MSAKLVFGHAFQCRCDMEKYRREFKVCLQHAHFLYIVDASEDLCCTRYHRIHKKNPYKFKKKTIIPQANMRLGTCNNTMDFMIVCAYRIGTILFIALPSIDCRTTTNTHFLHKIINFITLYSEGRLFV